jgi:hypothetical protein
VTAVPFDTLKLADRLQAGGFTADQARATASALADVASGFDLATKSDVQTLAVTTKRDLVDLEQRLIIRLGGLAVVLTGLALAVMHYLPPHG